jgi:hypothetical protein
LHRAAWYYVIKGTGKGFFVLENPDVSDLIFVIGFAIWR